MKTIGLLGGMSWESTVLYYQLINQGVQDRLGGLSSAKIVLRSVNFQEIVDALQTDRAKLRDILQREAILLEEGGAECLLICCNTVHKIADDVQQAIGIPLFHIADSTGERLQKDGKRVIGLLGSQFTMRQGFYRKRLMQHFGMEVIVPPVDDRIQVHQIIETQLCRGTIRSQDRDAFLRVIDRLYQRGAEAIVLGCTEIGLLLRDGDHRLPFYDTARIHAEQAVEWACAEV